MVRAATELCRCQSFSGAAAFCASSLETNPDNIALRLLYAQALLALRQDTEAQKQLQQCLRAKPRCAQAYRMLGELALRRDELKSAEIFFREALRLEPADKNTELLLDVVLGMLRPTAVVKKLPADSTAVGCPFPPPPAGRKDFPAGTQSDARVPLPPLPRPRQPVPARRRLGEYLVEIGIITPAELAAALSYHRSTRVQLGGAVVALGYVSHPKLEWAAQAFHGRYGDTTGTPHS